MMESGCVHVGRDARAHRSLVIGQRTRIFNRTGVSMNRLKKEEMRKYREAREGLSDYHLDAI